MVFIRYRHRMLQKWLKNSFNAKVCWSVSSKMISNLETVECKIQMGCQSKTYFRRYHVDSYIHIHADIIEIDETKL